MLQAPGWERMAQRGLGQPFESAPTCLAPGNRRADKVQHSKGCRGREGRGKELGFQQETQHHVRTPAAAARQKDYTRPACSQHRQLLSPSLCPPQLQMSQLRRVPEIHFSSPVLPQTQTSLRLQVKAGLQDTAKVPTAGPAASLPAEGISTDQSISPSYLPPFLHRSRPIRDQHSSRELQERCELPAQ